MLKLETAREIARLAAPSMPDDVIRNFTLTVAQRFADQGGALASCEAAELERRCRNWQADNVGSKSRMARLTSAGRATPVSAHECLPGHNDHFIADGPVPESAAECEYGEAEYQWRLRRAGF